MSKDLTDTHPNDWLEITIKFRGKCSLCGRQITSGRALWSKSTKAVKHIECPSSNVDNQATAGTNQRECAIHGSEKGFATAQQIKSQQQTIELKCFICGNKTTLTNENDYDDDDSTDYNDYYKGKSSHAYICQSCLKREDAYEAYQQSFMQKMNKYLKQK